MSMAERITQKLQHRFSPVLLELVDESESHRGHAGYRDGGETHFHLTIVSPDFENVPRIARQRMIYTVLQIEMQDGVHALSIKALAPSEWAK